MPSAPCTRAALSSAPASGPAAMAALASNLGALQVGGSCRTVAASALPSVRHSPLLAAGRPRLAPSCSSFASSSSSSSSSPSASAAPFSTSTPCQSHRMRRSMRAWYAMSGARFKPTKTSKLRASTSLDTTGEPPQEKRVMSRPFPLNPFFRSQPILGDEARELVWNKVMRRGESLKQVAVELSIDMRRVAAIVRLKEVEKAWIDEGRPLAKVYAEAVESMLPVNNYGPRDQVNPHEPISEIHAHGYAAQQLFLPVPESRHFTREAAAKAFHRNLLPPEKRLPIPELVPLERDVLTGQRTPEESFAAFRDKAAEEHRVMAKRDREAAIAEHERTTRADTKRFQFRIRDVNAENVGKDGRSPQAVGWRYGLPLNDRRRGKVRIPTSVG